MALKHPIWTYFSPKRNESFRATCLLCQLECDGGPRGTGGQGSGGKWWARQMIQHLVTCHAEEYKLFKRAELKRNVENGGDNPEDAIKSILDKEMFKQALVELKAENIKNDPFETETVLDPLENVKDPIELACNMCPKNFKYKHILNRHIRKIHKICEMCGFESMKRLEMKQHTEGHKTRHMCKICYKTYARFAILKYHVSSAHEGKRFECDKCDHTSTQRANIKEHNRLVHLAIKFMCSLCERKFSSNLLLDQHIATKHEGQKNFGCSKCSFKTAFKWKLKHHQKGKHEGELVIDQDGKFTCPQCDYKSREKSVIRSHIKVYHDNIKVECDHCPSTFNSKFSMENHKRYTHLGETHKCELCPDKLYTNTGSLRKHVEIEHEGKRHACKHCEYVATRTDTLLIHMNENHAGLNNQKARMQCEICPKTFGIANILKRHMIYHSEERPLGCLKCSQRFREKNNLKRHMKTHSEVREMTFACPDCDRKFTESAHLRRHRISQHEGQRGSLMKQIDIELKGKKYACKHCKYVATRTDSLLKHMNKKHTYPNIQNVRLQCKFCPKTFRVAHLLKSHMVSHSEEKPNGCQKCSLRFKEPRNLTRHMKTHSEVRYRPYVCNNCDRTYTDSAHLRRHRLEKH